jgi:type I restriction enzyme S subunit
MSNVPKLRFGEFNGEWKEKRLNSFSFRSAEKNRDNNINLVFTNSAVKGIVNQQDYFDKDIANQNNLEGYYIVNKDDFIYNPRISNSAPVGPLNRNHLNDKGIMSPLYTIFKMDEKKINLDFIEKFFKTAKWHKYMNSVANYGARSDRMNITNNDFFKMLIFVPLKEEQEKIASFLISVDKKIEQLTKKESLLQDYKKGVMRKIFNQEIRFKDENGIEFPEWEEKLLNQLMYEHKERNYEKKYTKNDVLSVSGSYGIVNQIEFQGRSFAGASVHNYHLVEIDDIVYTKSPLKSNPYGIIKTNKFKNGIVSTLYAVYRPKECLFSEYINYYFEIEDNVNKYLRPLVQKGAKNDMKINNQHVLSGYISIPQKREQTKIVNFLSLLDKKIENTKIELERIKEFKKALLQQMFV